MTRTLARDRRSALLVAAALAFLSTAFMSTALSTGCLIDPLDLNNKACDADHPCTQGYSCVNEVCEVDDGDADDSG